MNTNERKTAAETAVSQLLRESSGFELAELDHQATFPELGFDSLFLVQFSQKLKAQLKVKVTFRQLIEKYPSLDSLIGYIASQIPESQIAASDRASTNSVNASRPDSASSSNEESAPTLAPSGANAVSGMAPQRASLAADAMESPTDALGTNSAKESAPEEVHLTPAPALVQENLVVDASRDRAGLARIIAQQNELMSLQLQLLGNGPLQVTSSGSTKNLASSPSVTTPSTSMESRTAPPPTESTTAQCDSLDSLSSDASASDIDSPCSQVSDSPVARASEKKFERFGPYKPVRHSEGGGLTQQQQASLDELISRFTRKTAKSRRHAEAHRPHFADPRGVAGYRRIWKSMVYQIAVASSKGSKLQDIDGNEYIDIAMGFGLNLFGQSPDFITSAIAEQLKHGVEVGPQSPLAGEVAQLLCDFSRMDRVTFCNTGSEAVMAAMRLARTVTGKSKIVFFNRDYHGNFDQVLIRSNRIANRRKSQPAAPGVPQTFADQAIVLDYGTEEAIETIRNQGNEIAAVLVEPVQSADPFNQPREFLHELRRVTKQEQIAMVMDEVITGFRAAPGGAQEWFGVWGDMATYGKVLGGGLPIGALAGSCEYMDALDGGFWKYDDESEPEADMTFFAGTFVRHPLAMTAAHQVLMKVKENGPELQQQLTERTSYLVNTLNNFFERELYAIRMAQFTSLFRFMFPPTVEYADLLYFHLLDRGIFTRGWGDNCFLSTAHSDEDVERIIKAVKESCEEIRAGGFFPKPAATAENGATGTAIPTGKPDSQRINQPHQVVRETSLPTEKAPFRMSTVEEIREEGDRPPLFCMPAADGLTLVFHELVNRLGIDQPVYGLNSPGAYGEPVPDTIEEMASRFIEDMRQIRPHGPYLLIGYCSGGTIAFEAAQQLIAAGEKVPFVCGIETYDWGTAQSSNPTLAVKLLYEIQRLEFHVRNFLILDSRNKRAFLRSKLNRLRNRLAVWRGKIADLLGPKKEKPAASRNQINWNHVWRAHDAQADRYVPQPLPGKLLLIRPRKDYRSYVGREDLRATEGVTVERLPAYPAGLMTPPYVDQVAAIVEREIDDRLGLGMEVEPTERRIASKRDFANTLSTVSQHAKAAISG